VTGLNLLRQGILIKVYKNNLSIGKQFDIPEWHCFMFIFPTEQQYKKLRHSHSNRKLNVFKHYTIKHKHQ
jgi:hypothetical protein